MESALFYQHRCAAKFAKKSSLRQLSIAPNNTIGKTHGHAWSVSTRHVPAAAAMRSLTVRTSVDLCATNVVILGALGVAKQDLNEVTAKTIRCTSSLSGSVPIVYKEILLHSLRYSARCAKQQSLCKHSVRRTQNITKPNPIGRAWSVSTRHVPPAAAMRSLTGRSSAYLCARNVVIHRALAVAKQDLDEVTAKTIR